MVEPRYQVTDSMFAQSPFDVFTYNKSAISVMRFPNLRPADIMRANAEDASS